MDGFQNWNEARTQIDVWAETYAATRTIGDLVIATVIPRGVQNGVRFDRSSVDLVQDLGEQTNTGYLFRNQIDCNIRYSYEGAS
jgi:hypothetical protein